MTHDELQTLLKAKEGEQLEFKEAKQQLDPDELTRYLCALANEGGGRIILGVTDKLPRRVVGSLAFTDLERARKEQTERLQLKVQAEAVDHPDGRVVVFTVPSRPVGVPIHWKGAYLMRAGDALVPMTPDQLKAIFDETVQDYSAEICRRAGLDDLDPACIETFRQMWVATSGNKALKRKPVPQLLEDAELLHRGKVTYAALVLLGTHQALGRHLGMAEVVFEYRSSEASIAHQQRKEYRQGFIGFHDDLWQTINLRNDLFSYLEGFVRRQLPSFNEDVVREAVLNAVSHRDYRKAGSVFVRQFPERIEIVSPGGFPAGITPENLLWNQNPRNRRIADSLRRCGMVERSGQGADRMFSACVREAKLVPDFSRSGAHQVWVSISGKVRDAAFIRFLEQLTAETQATLSVGELLTLDYVQREARIPESLRPHLDRLRDVGAIERSGRKVLLSRRYFELAGRAGVHTRKLGLDRETNKALLLKHIESVSSDGARFDEFTQVLPHLLPSQIKVLLRELKAAGRARVEGQRKSARWYLGGPKKGGR
ncbi:MAG: ATP-binding protein [Polyangia bacterium]|jgi:ATP-dependent DNA helicase RecG|nr:ATP-binding protein [Polyangia bacterium]